MCAEAAFMQRLTDRWQYLRRVTTSYVLPGQSQLTFWHEDPELNPAFLASELGAYYMTFFSKADYAGQLDADGIPLLDYHGILQHQYNPIAIAQYGLGNYNKYVSTDDDRRLQRAIWVADWLTTNLDPNSSGVPVWMHHFDWEYRQTLQAPWYSGLAQGQGISLLLRVYKETRNQKYLGAAQSAIESMLRTVKEGGVINFDEGGDPWIEEYIVEPPTHILNGFMWALWGVWDYYLATGDERAKDLWDRCIVTLKKNLHRYDLGWWSLYEQSGTRLKMIASPFYHRLHIVQLQVMEKLTGDEFFGDYARRWEDYTNSWFNRKRAFAQKVLFKILYY